MVYKKNFALAIKANGKILREREGQVFLPYGCEYSIVLKNLNHLKASVKISVDGSSITDNASLILHPNETVELERFIRNGNVKSGNKLKFIERTSSIEEFRDNKIDDGLVRIEYQFEKQVEHFYRSPTLSPPSILGSSPFYYGHSPVYDHKDALYRRSFNPNEISCQGVSSSSSYSSANVIPCVNQVGITVPGDVSHQEFVNAIPLNLQAETFSLVLQLVGEVTPSETIQQPLSVKSKIQCSTCGKMNKSAFKFCQNCGTSLKII